MSKQKHRTLEGHPCWQIVDTIEKRTIHKRNFLPVSRKLAISMQPEGFVRTLLQWESYAALNRAWFAHRFSADYSMYQLASDAIVLNAIEEFIPRGNY